MLQKLNERIQGVIAWVIIILIVVTFALFGVDYYTQSRQGSNAEVEVNGYPITKQTFELNFRRTRQQRDPAEMTTASETQLKKQVLDEMIINEVSLQSARNYGFEVNANQANAAIVNIPQFQENGRFSEARYEQALNSAFFTPQSFQNEVRQGMLLNQQRFAFIGSAFALPSEIEQFVTLYMQTRDYDYLQIPVARFLNQAKITEEAITHYYQQHQKEFFSPEKVSVDYIQFAMRDIKDKIQIPDQDIVRYYTENQGNYLTPAQWHVAHILFAIPSEATDTESEAIRVKAEKTYKFLQANPAAFAHEAKTLSDDKISAMHEGTLPWIVAGDTEYNQALIQLTKPNQISEPLRTSHGYEVFKLLEYKPAATKPLEQVKEEIKEQLLTDLTQTKYNQALEELSDLSYQTPDSLSPVADKLQLTITQSEPFSRQGGSSEFSKNKQIIKAAFSHDVLELGNNSEPVQLDNEAVVVLRVNKHIPATAKSLPEVRQTILDYLIRKEAENFAKQLGTQLLNPKLTQVEQEQVMKANNLQWQPITHAARDADNPNPLINEWAFNLARPGAQFGGHLENGDFALVQLKRVNKGQVEALDKEQQDSIIQQIETTYGLMDYDLYVNNLLNKAQIARHG